MTHSELVAAIQLAYSNNDTRLWRTNAGQAWFGLPVQRTPTTITLKHPRPAHLMPEGFPDLSGLHSVTVTPEMVGRVVALFVGVECKTGTGRLSESQSLFLDLLRSAGALHGVARTVEDAGRILRI